MTSSETCRMLKALADEIERQQQLATSLKDRLDRICGIIIEVDPKDPTRITIDAEDLESLVHIDPALFA